MKLKIKIIIALASLFLLSGCWNYNELNSLAIATSMGIDKEGDNYKVSVLIANSKKDQASSMEGESQTVVFSGTGKSITDAMRSIEALSPKKVYISHLSVVVLSKEVAEDGLDTINDYFLRNPASIKRFYAIVAEKDKAADIVKIISPLESFPSQNIYSNIQVSSHSQAIGASVSYSDFVQTMMQKGKEAYLPLVTITGDPKAGSNQEGLMNVEPPAILKIENVALFKGDKMIDKISNRDETMGINLILGHVEEMNVQTACQKGYINTVLSSVHTNVKINLKKNQPKVTIKIKGLGKMNEIACNVDLKNSKTPGQIEKDIEKKVRELVLRGLKSLQNKKVDTLGIGNLFYKHHPNFFNKNMKKWNDDIFPNLDPVIDVDIHLVSKGSIQDTVKGEIRGK